MYIYIYQFQKIYSNRQAPILYSRSETHRALRLHSKTSPGSTPEPDKGGDVLGLAPTTIPSHCFSSVPAVQMYSKPIFCKFPWLWGSKVVEDLVLGYFDYRTERLAASAESRIGS